MGQTSSNFPYVSLYAMGGRWRATLAKIGGRRITKRLGTSAAHARTMAARYSDWLQQWKANLITEAKLLHLLNESQLVEPLVDRYRRGLVAEKRNAQYVRDRVAQLRKLFRVANITQVKQITVPAVTRGLDAMRDAAEAEDERLSDQTLFYYFAAARQFAAWMASKSHVERDPLEHAVAPKVGDRVHNRRAPTRLEMELLVGHLWCLPRRGREKLAGRDRAMLYLLATCTGLRVGEIRQLRHEWIETSTGLLRVPASVTKNGKEAVQPLPTWLVASIDGWHSGAAGPLFPTIPHDAAEMLRRDQVAARDLWVAAGADAKERERREKADTLRYQTSAGIFDFHALRHGYVTTLGNSGATVRDTQTLARHSTPMLTIGTYSHSEAGRLRTVVDGAFMDLTPKDDNSKGGRGEAHAHRAAQSGV